jgi:hypothetical protein
MIRFLIFLVLFSTTLELTTQAQRRRTVEFQRDLNVMPGAGKYSISGYNGLPYWISSDSVYLQIQTKAPFIPVWSIGSDREDTLSFYSHLVTVWFDETEIWFPPKDSIPDGWYYHFTYHGIDADTINFVDVDTLDTIYFPDSIWGFSAANNTWSVSNYMSSTHPNRNFQIKKDSHFQAYFILPEKRWVIQRREWYEYDY